MGVSECDCTSQSHLVVRPGLMVWTPVIQSNGLFNLTTASAVAAQGGETLFCCHRCRLADYTIGHPDTTGTAAPLVTIVSTTTYIYPFATTLSPSATGASSSSSSSEFVVPLVGGVVGGVVGLVLLGCLAVFLRRRSKLRSMSVPHEQAARFVSPGIYPASPEWVYEPWSPMSSTVTVLNVRLQSEVLRRPHCVLNIVAEPRRYSDVSQALSICWTRPVFVGGKLPYYPYGSVGIPCDHVLYGRSGAMTSLLSGCGEMYHCSVLRRIIVTVDG